MISPDCPYCSRPAVLTRRRIPGEAHQEFFWVCHPCDARIKAHFKSKMPMGKMANKALRLRRISAHRAFDVKWLFNGNRSKAYRELSEHLELSSADCHIANFDTDMCKRVIAYARGEQYA